MFSASLSRASRTAAPATLLPSTGVVTHTHTSRYSYTSCPFRPSLLVLSQLRGWSFVSLLLPVFCAFLFPALSSHGFATMAPTTTDTHTSVLIGVLLVASWRPRLRRRSRTGLSRHDQPPHHHQCVSSGAAVRSAGQVRAPIGVSICASQVANCYVGQPLPCVPSI